MAFYSSLFLPNKCLLNEEMRALIKLKLLEMERN